MTYKAEQRQNLLRSLIESCVIFYFPSPVSRIILPIYFLIISIIPNIVKVCFFAHPLFVPANIILFCM